jgi:hypothetical protein
MKEERTSAVPGSAQSVAHRYRRIGRRWLKHAPKFVGFAEAVCCRDSTVAADSAVTAVGRCLAEPDAEVSTSMASPSGQVSAAKSCAARHGFTSLQGTYGRTGD